ncbi:MAG: hypothetical protein AAB438_01805 [Patescibacteria group bacterium]
MKKALSKTLIVLVVMSIFMSPFSVFFQANNSSKVSIEQNKAYAQNFQSILPGSSLQYVSSSQTTADFKYEIKNPNAEMNAVYHVNFLGPTLGGFRTNFMYIVIFDNSNNVAGYLNISSDAISALTNNGNIWPQTWSNQLSVGNLTAGTAYTAKIYYQAVAAGQGGGENLFNSTDKDWYFIQGTEASFTTPADGQLQNGNWQASSTSAGLQISGRYGLGCSFGIIGEMNLPGCVAQLFYTLWEASAWIARAAGSLLDFFVFYSTSSTSYGGEFVDKGWAVVRDLANIMFIIVLIYIAIKTIFSLSVTDNKKLISWIIIMALIINFSLFITKVVIDASNILAKVFYNQINPVYKNGESAPAGGEKSISIQMVKKYDPQAIITTKAAYDNNIGLFIFITILLLLITLYTAYIFFVVALLFVGRVITLWLLMIFSPMAFASHAMPSTWEIGSIGHKKWWPELFRAAFMAPIFIFFLYLIVLFLSTGLGATYADSSETMQKLMHTIIPFLLLFVLLSKAKDMAVEYSGDAGKAMMGITKMVGGIAGGAVVGGAALAGTRLIGAYANSKVSGASGERLKERANQKGMGGWIAKQQLKALNYGSKATFDVRKTALGSKITAGTGMDFQGSKIVGLGSKEGGFKGAQDRQKDILRKESELYKTSMSDKDVTAWSEERMLKYQKDRAAAVDKDAFDQTHEPPKMYTKADELNKDRLKDFQDRLGQTDLLGSLAHSAAAVTVGMVNKNNFGEGNNAIAYNKIHKEEAERTARLDAAKAGREFNKEAFDSAYVPPTDFDEKIATKINNGRTKAAKMIIGGAAAVTLGGITGGVPIGNIVGGGMAYGQSTLDTGAEKKLSSEIDKELSGRAKIDDRIIKLDTLISEQTAIKEKGKAIKFEVRDTNGNLMSTEDVVSGDGKINKEVLNDKVVENSVEVKSLNIELETLTKKLHEAGNATDYEARKTELRGKMATGTITKAETDELTDLNSRVSTPVDTTEITRKINETKAKLTEKVKESETLTSLKTVDEKIGNADKEKTELTGKKSEIGK